jgi:hypothetical protein
MRMRITTCVAVCLVVGILSYLATTGQLASAWKWIRNDYPRVEYPARLDLGSHEIGDQVVVPFTIANRGGRELVIDQIRSNCSCTGMERVQEGKYSRIETLRLRPYERANLLVMRVSVRGVPAGAEMLNFVEFQTNDESQPIGHIDVIVNRVTRGVSTSPGTVVFGTTPVGSTIRQVLDVRDTAAPPRRIDRVTSTDPCRLRVSLLPDPGNSREKETNPDGVLIGRVEVIVDTDKPGAVNAAVQVHLAGEKREPDLVTVVGTVAAPIEISPSLVILPRSSASGPIYTVTCICLSTLGQPLTVSADSLPAGITAEFLEGGSTKARRVRITWDPTRGKPHPAGRRESLRFRARAGDYETVLKLEVLLHT